ncbi:uncharacterized protein LOC129116220 [Anoplopoma fimbria]|uniref:uncharacterized protein LOC129116220 n=1 Tax=Anoplopoma fimbria TaxID=229290 RepID=UPI0023ECDE12|nr:uncharacterized protein LOC129116220 [Anoplopoma fimbria]
MTKPKTKACLHCHGMNAANRKTCQSCFASLSIKERIKLKEESLRSGDWGGKVKEHRNAGRVVDSARISVKKLHELDFKPLLFMGRERRGGCSAEVITGIGPIPEGPVREIIKRMTALYEYFIRNYSELLATTTAPSDEATPAASAATSSSLEESLPILNLVPVPHQPLMTPSLSSSPQTNPSLPTTPLPTPSLSSPPPFNSPRLSSPPTTLSLPSSPPANPPLPSPPLATHSLPSPPTTQSLSPHTTLSLSSSPPATPSLSFLPPSNPPLTSPPVKGLMRTKKELLGKRKRNKHTGCKKHSWQKLFFFEKIIERRSNKGIEEVRVHWKSCSACGKEWEDTWEPAVNFSI